MTIHLTDEQVSDFSRRDSPVAAHLARSLAREVQASRKLIAELRELHRPLPVLGEEAPWCSHDGFAWPCPTIRLIDKAGL